MASYTTNLNLKKPAGSENVAIGDINNNMDTIDQAYGTLNSKYVVDKKTLGTSQSISVGNFEITFNVTKSGYSAIGIVGWSFEDRSVAQAMHLSGSYTSNSTTAKMYGSCSSACTISANAYVLVLYSKA